MDDHEIGSTSFKMPLFERLQIESQSLCNRACWFCPRTYDHSGVYLDSQGKSVVRRMSTEAILDLLDQARDLGFRGDVSFFYYSEPFLDGRNIMLAEQAKRRGMRPYVHTNGDILRRDKRLCAEVRRVYGRVVVGLYDHETEEQLAEAKRYWLDRLAGVQVFFSVIGPTGRALSANMGVPRAQVPTDKRMATPDLTFLNAPCQRPLIRALVQYDGTLANCCEDTTGDFGLGNVFESSLGALWYSDRHVEIVRNLLAGRRDLYRLCQRCPQPPSGPAPDGLRISIMRRRYRGEQPEGRSGMAQDSSEQALYVVPSR